MRVFKYTNYISETLLDRRFKVSKANTLNDPFELSPLIDPNQFTLPVVMELLKKPHMVEEAYRQFGLQKGFRSLEDYKQWHFQPTSLQEIASYLSANIPKNVEEERARFAQRFDSYWRIFSGSKRFDSVLMWSHYTKDHTGAVVEFDIADPGFPDIDKGLILPVIYSQSKPLFHYWQDVEDFLQKMLTVVQTKAGVWSYEEELRLVFEKAACIDEQFVPFEESAVKRVFFGCRCPSQLREEICRLLGTPPYSHVSIEAAHVNKDEYKLDFEVIR